MKKFVKHIALFLMLSLILAGNVAAQRISFGTYASRDIILIPPVNGLNFNGKQPIILAGQTVTIDLNDNAAAVLEIRAQRNLDITVTIDAPANLSLGSNNIPLTLRYAYSNVGKANDSEAKQAYVLVPAGFTSITFPVLRRASGPPAPPPTPNHVGYIAPDLATAYLFIFGSLGPVPTGAAAGMYEGHINIRVEYTKY